MVTLELYRKGSPHGRLFRPVARSGQKSPIRIGELISICHSKLIAKTTHPEFHQSLEHGVRFRREHLYLRSVPCSSGRGHFSANASGVELEHPEHGNVLMCVDPLLRASESEQPRTHAVPRPCRNRIHADSNTNLRVLMSNRGFRSAVRMNLLATLLGEHNHSGHEANEADQCHPRRKHL